MSEIENDCYCNQLTVIKKGFSGSYAIGGFMFGMLFSWFIIWVCYPNGNISSAAYSIASLFCILCLFAGTIGMNKLLSVCPKCGKTTNLN
jgi:hypothetical protein